MEFLSFIYDKCHKHMTNMYQKCPLTFSSLINIEIILQNIASTSKLLDHPRTMWRIQQCIKVSFSSNEYGSEFLKHMASFFVLVTIITIV